MPRVVVSNFAEAHAPFLLRATPAQRATLIDSEAYHGDRTLLWLGDHKLVIVSHSIAHGADLCARLGYRDTRWAVPAQPTTELSCDIARDPALLDLLLTYAGPARRLQLVPYATTPQFLALAEQLRRNLGLEILLPESPLPADVWLRDYIDTKSGFHHLAARWLPDADRLLPEAYVCRSLEQTAAVVYWFSQQQRAAIVKADAGENGIGNLVVPPARFASRSAIHDHVAQIPFWGDEPLVVEELIPSSAQLSPSAEVSVPALGLGDPTVTYVSDQLFLGFGDFCGVLLSRDLQEKPWYRPLVDSSLVIARRLQAMGYVGHFDIDAVVDDQGRVYLLELNARRTGGTHAHEFAHFYFGPDYLTQIAILSWESIDSGGVTTSAALYAALAGLLFPIANQPRGVIVTVTTALVMQKFGVLIVGADTADIRTIQGALVQRLAAAG